MQCKSRNVSDKHARSQQLLWVFLPAGLVRGVGVTEVRPRSCKTIEIFPSSRAHVHILLRCRRALVYKAVRWICVPPPVTANVRLHRWFSQALGTHVAFADMPHGVNSGSGRAFF